MSEKLKKGTGRTSETSSQPPSADGPKKPNRDKQKPQRKRGPQYNHPGTTRHGFGWINHAILLNVEKSPICGGTVERQPQRTKRQQVAELVPDLVEIWEYERPLYRSHLNQQNKQIPAIALTAYAREFDQQRALQAGFQAHITKPVEPEALVEEISRLLRQPNLSGTIPPSIP
ncbi:MAG: response regulator [Nodosilinea sp.]